MDFKIFFMTIKSVFTNEGNEDDGSSEVNDLSTDTNSENVEENSTDAEQEVVSTEEN